VALVTGIGGFRLGGQGEQGFGGLLFIIFPVVAYLLLSRWYRRVHPQYAAFYPAPAPAPAPALSASANQFEASPFAGGGPTPSKWDGTGWVQDESGWVWKTGDGHFWSDTQKVWVFKPEILSGLPASPGPVPVQVKFQHEFRELRTPCPTPWQAFRAVQIRRSPARMYVLTGWFIGLCIAAMGAGAMDSPDSGWFGPFFLIVLGLASWPFSIWWVYYSHLRQVAPKKATAFAIASYAATAVGMHAAANRPMPGPLGVPGGGGNWAIPAGTNDAKSQYYRKS
jgi:hypothetical protein